MSTQPVPPSAAIDDPRYTVDQALNSDPMGIYANLSEVETAGWSRARQFVTDEVLPVIADYWEQAEYPLHLVRRMGELDLLRDGVEVPGAPEVSRVAAGLTTMELARGDGSIATVVAVQGGLAMRSIELHGSTEQKKRYLPQLASGELLGAFALTEPTHGSDSVGLETTAVPTEDGWLLTGQKKWIGNGSNGGITIVWARSTADEKVKGFIVPQDSDGYQAQTIEGKTSLRAIDQAHIRLDEVFVPHDGLLPGSQSFRDTSAVLFTTRVGVAWAALGQGLACYEAALQYVQQRHQFGRPLAATQIVQERLARMTAELAQAQMLVLQAARREDAGTLSGAQASLAKFTATRTARSIAQNARDMLGGNGILLEHLVARHFSDIEALHTYEGTETMQALIIGRHVTGFSAFA